MIYILRPIDGIEKNPWECRYDVNFGFIVEASNEKEAREIAAKNKANEGENAWLIPANSTCKELIESGQSGIIMSDFNAV